jgi:hypothetical protein
MKIKNLGRSFMVGGYLKEKDIFVIKGVRGKKENRAGKNHSRKTKPQSRK